MASVGIEKLHKRYGAYHAVKGVDLEIEDHEFLVLVGSSGCGKSTTLRMVAGLEKISEGRIRIGDRIVNELAPMDRDIAMVFQNYALYPHMTVFDNMAFGLKMRGLSRADIGRRVSEAAAILGMSDHLERKPKQLSGGQRQRVALGRAIVRDPQVFLFDEPLSNLDAKLRASMRVEIKRVQQRLGTTSIYVTHDQVEAMTLGDRIVVMRDGVIQQVGTPLDLYNRPANKYVAGFIGSPGMNFLQARVDAQEHEIFLNGEDIRIKVPAAAGKRLEPFAGKSIILGVRPEDFRVDSDLDGLTSRLDVEVEVVEQLGAESLFNLRCGMARLVARMPPSTRVLTGERITLAVEPGGMHYFDAATELPI
ncbi:ABC transporter ATP-binding protein [Bradyrhizobium ottawaense]|uniref:ABC transporter ATP-binding protein n=1 Tax=Bradyrhizobium ottawaense TaxID=931866 RepID=UPI00383287D3